MDNNNLDKLFRNKLQQRKFDVDVEQWQAMEEIISHGNVTEPAGYKRRFIFLISFALIAVTAVLTTCYILNDISENNTVLLDDTAVPIVGGDRSLENVNERDVINEESIIQNKASSLTASIYNKDIEIVNQESLQLFSSSADLITKNTELDQEESVASDIANKKDTAIRKKQSIEHIQRSGLFSYATTLLTEELVNKEEDTNAFLEKSPKINQVSLLSNTDRSQLDEIDNLSKRYAYLELPVKDFRTNLIGTGGIRVLDTRMQQRGFYTQYRNIENGTAGSVGIYLGANIINSNWSIVFAPAYEYAQLNAFTVAEQLDNVYSFSVQDHNQQIMANRIHSVVFPVSVHYNMSNHLLGVGIVYQRPLAVGAEKKIYIGEEVAEARKIWVDTDLYDRNVLKGRFSYEYFFSQKIGLGVNYDFPLSKQSNFCSKSSIGLQLKMNI